MSAIVIQKHSQRRLDELTMRRQVDRILSRMGAGGRSKVWRIMARDEPVKGSPDAGYVYGYRLTFTRTGRMIPEDVRRRQVSRMLEIGAAAGNASAWQFPGVTPAAKPEANGEPTPIFAARSYADVIPSTDRGTSFDHIYERDAQIEIIHSAVRAFVDSQYENRFHCVLYGEPACGKTEILHSFARMLGSDAVLELDATSTTKAGAERILLESAKVPPVLLCEEIEKTDEASLRWLLGLLDHRAEIRKVTHGAGLRQRSVKMLCLATVNDLPLFKRVMDGALASRFSHKVWCPRPSKAVLHRILSREISKVNGNPEWAAPAIDYCVDVEGTNDPRRAITVALSGRDRLLTGHYQALLQAVTQPKE